MRKNVLWISMLAVAMLSACTTKENNEKPIMTPTPTATVAPTETMLPMPTNTPVATPTPTKEQAVQIYLRTLDTIDWTELDCYVDEETSIRNSNLLNYGYLTYDEEGNIYFVNRNDKNIYKSSSNGEKLQLVGGERNTFGWLQLKEDWLYYTTNKNAIKRIHIKSGEIESIQEDYSGAFVIVDDKMYFENKEEGFVCGSLDGKNEQTIFKSNGYLELFTTGNACWVGKFDGESMEISKKNYLVLFDEDNMQLLRQRGKFPLLAGNYLSIVDEKTQMRHVLNLETKEDIDLNIDTEKVVVSDGKDFYYADRNGKEGDNFYKGDSSDICGYIYHWDGTAAEEIWEISGAIDIYHMFLTPDAIYCLPQVSMDGKFVYQLWYYDLLTGETGQIY